jgi:asparagine synthetase B (glutamine-hydrolysing)
MRRTHEQDGTRFYTENDSEIVGIYLAKKLGEGASLEEAMETSVKELDGSFSYLAATADAFGFAKDPFCLKPLLVGEDVDAIAVANEESALHAALSSPYTAREEGPPGVAGSALAVRSPASHSAQPVILARIHETKIRWASGIRVARLKGWKSQKT